MSRDDSHSQAVEQSWIVLDEQGWPSSRPPTASPNRPFPRMSPFREDDEEENESQILSRRIGMDRDVREALELAERSLELAGSVDEFAFRTARDGVEDEGTALRASPLNNYVARSVQQRDEFIEDPYNGRAPPTVRRSFTFPNDQERSVFENVNILGDEQDGSPNLSSPSHEGEISLMKASTERHTIPYNVDDEETDDGFLQWFFGLQHGASFLPVVLSHTLTLMAGVYLGYRRATAIQSATSTSPNVSNTSHQ